jgi:hypothetical protein
MNFIRNPLAFVKFKDSPENPLINVIKFVFLIVNSERFRNTEMSIELIIEVENDPKSIFRIPIGF